MKTKWYRAVLLALAIAVLGAIIALGNFDGFHRGHQAVAGEAIRWAHEA